MALLSVQDVPTAGVDDITFVAAEAGGDTASTAGGGVALVVKNTDTAAKTVTVETPNTVDGLAIDDISRIVPANTGIAVIPLRARLVGDIAQITYSAVTGVEVGAVRIAR